MSSKDEPLGSVFNPHEVGERYIVRFPYDQYGYFEVHLESDGSLVVRTSGRFSDMISIDAHVANDIRIVPRRWDDTLKRRVQLVKEETETR